MLMVRGGEENRKGGGGGCDGKWFAGDRIKYASVGLGWPPIVGKESEEKDFGIR